MSCNAAVCDCVVLRFFFFPRSFFTGEELLAAESESLWLPLRVSLCRPLKDTQLSGVLNGWRSCESRVGTLLESSTGADQVPAGSWLPFFPLNCDADSSSSARGDWNPANLGDLIAGLPLGTLAPSTGSALLMETDGTTTAIASWGWPFSTESSATWEL